MGITNYTIKINDTIKINLNVETPKSALYTTVGSAYT